MRIRRVAISSDSVRGYVFLGLSVGGRIARPDGDLDWLTSRGAAAGDAVFTPFMNSVDAVLMGRRTYEAIASAEHWPYLDRPIHVVSTGLAADADPRITVHRSAESAVDILVRDGHRRVSVDGGQTVQWFLASGLIDELTKHIRTVVLDGGMVQTTYRVLGRPQAPAAAEIRRLRSCAQAYQRRHDVVVRGCPRALSVERLTPHDLRRTAASLAISSGANVKAVQRMLGRKSAAMTLDTYADLFEDDFADVAARMNQGGLDDDVTRLWAVRDA